MSEETDTDSGSASPIPFDTPLFGASARLDPDGALARALGREPRQDELILWAALATEYRDRAIRRIALLRRWEDQPGEMTAAEAAEELGTSTSRFYQILAKWKDDPALHVVGSFATKSGNKGSRVDSAVAGMIEKVLPDLVKANESEPISAIVQALAASPELEGLKLPHLNTLRTMVEREKRQLQSEKQVGGRPGFDATACELARPDGSYHIMFAIVDRTSRLILGFSVGDVHDSLSAYARAARDALDRIGQPEAATLPWADAMTRFDVIIGEDLDAWTTMQKAALTSHYECSLVQKGRRYGRYLKLAAGDAIGEMKIFPKRTDEDGWTAGGASYADAAALTAIEVEVARHNAMILSNNVATGAPRPAPTLVRMLELIAGGSQG